MKLTAILQADQMNGSCKDLAQFHDIVLGEPP